MWKRIKKMFSFRLSDLVGVITGLSIVLSSNSDTDLFYKIISYKSYLAIFLIVFLVHALIFLFVYHGELPYLKQTIFDLIRDTIRLILAYVSVVGIYFLTRLFS